MSGTKRQAPAGNGMDVDIVERRRRVVRANWEKNIPILYDAIVCQALDDPSYSCDWGSVTRTSKGGHMQAQTMYFSQSTDAGVDAETGRCKGRPNILTVASVRMPTPLMADENRMGPGAAAYRSGASSVKVTKRIMHPGDISRLRACPQRPELVITQSNQSPPAVLLWNTDDQPNKRPIKNCGFSIPDLTLTGHLDAKNSAVGGTKRARFGLDFAADRMLLASGGADCAVCLWDLTDFGHTSNGNGSNGSHGNVGGNGSQDDATGPLLQARSRLVDASGGHKSAVQDIAFAPEPAANLLASADCDGTVLLWDRRAGSHPVHRLKGTHGDLPICSLSWNPNRPNMLATGGADGACRVLDARALRCRDAQGTEFIFSKATDWDAKEKADLTAPTGSESALANPVRSLRGGGQSLAQVSWSPHAPNALGTLSLDGELALWDIGAPAVATNSNGDSFDPALVMRHIGHRAPAAAFAWNPKTPWTIASVSDDRQASQEDGQGSVQVWRLTKLLTMPTDEAEATLSRVLAAVDKDAAESADEATEG